MVKTLLMENVSPETPPKTPKAPERPKFNMSEKQDAPKEKEDTKVKKEAGKKGKEKSKKNQPGEKLRKWWQFEKPEDRSKQKESGEDKESIAELAQEAKQTAATTKETAEKVQEQAIAVVESEPTPAETRTRRMASRVLELLQRVRGGIVVAEIPENEKQTETQAIDHAETDLREATNQYDQAEAQLRERAEVIVAHEPKEEAAGSTEPVERAPTPPEKEISSAKEMSVETSTKEDESPDYEGWDGGEPQQRATGGPTWSQMESMRQELTENTEKAQRNYRKTRRKMVALTAATGAGIYLNGKQHREHARLQKESLKEQKATNKRIAEEQQEMAELQKREVTRERTTNYQVAGERQPLVQSVTHLAERQADVTRDVAAQIQSRAAALPVKSLQSGETTESITYRDASESLDKELAAPERPKQRTYEAIPKPAAIIETADQTERNFSRDLPSGQNSSARGGAGEATGHAAVPQQAKIAASDATSPMSVAPTARDDDQPATPTFSGKSTNETWLYGAGLVIAILCIVVAVFFFS